VQIEPPPAAPLTAVVMGVSGSGKSTVARALVDLLGWPFAEGDDFHPSANVERMRAGTALTDEDRWPWLADLARWIGEQESAGRSAIVTCSALKRIYRETLRRGHPSVWFVHVTASRDGLQHRLEARRGHYLPAALLASQLETLEPLAADEPGATISGEGSPDEVASRVLDALRHARGLRLRQNLRADAEKDHVNP
jgi:gluconokinase